MVALPGATAISLTNDSRRSFHGYPSYGRQAPEIAAENVPVVYTTLSERLSAVRNVFGNMTPTLYAFWDIRYLYRTD